MNQKSNFQHPLDHRKGKKKSRKTSTSASLTTQKPLTVWITTNCGKILQEIPNHLTCVLRNLYADQEKTESEMKHWTGSKLGKEYIKAVYCQHAYLISMQSTSCEVLG